MIRGLYFAFIFLLAGFSYAQQSCSQLLNRAEDLYSEGRLLEIPGLISGCLETEGAFTEGEQVRARKLLTKVYVFTDNEAAAEAELVELLHVDPVHELQREDPSELRVMMAKFRTWPVYRIEVRGGVNTNVKSVHQGFSAFNETSGGAIAKEKNYNETVVLGWQLGVDVTRYLDRGIEVGAGFQYRQSGYAVNSAPDNFEFVTDIENSQTTLRLPIFARYNHNYDSRIGLVPYGFLGASFDYILKAKYTDASRSGGTSFTLVSEDASLRKFDQVNNVNYSLFVGAGAKIRLKKGNFAFAEVRFDKSLRLYNVPEERYANPSINGDLLYVEDDLYLNFVSINFGYIQSIFKPEKLIK